MTDKLIKTQRASFPRRLGAMFYDTLLLLGVYFVAGIPLVILSAQTREIPWVKLLIQVYLLAVGVTYFIGFWRVGGQTLGMRAWRLRLASNSGSPTLLKLLKRLGASLLSWLPAGAGFLWIIVDRKREALHDKISGTYIILDQVVVKPIDKPD